MTFHRIGDDPLIDTAESATLNPCVRKFSLEIFTEEQHSSYSGHKLIVVLCDSVQCMEVLFLQAAVLLECFRCRPKINGAGWKMSQRRFIESFVSNGPRKFADEWRVRFAIARSNPHKHPILRSEAFEMVRPVRTRIGLCDK